MPHVCLLRDSLATRNELRDEGGCRYHEETISASEFCNDADDKFLHIDNDQFSTITTLSNGGQLIRTSPTPKLEDAGS